MEIVYLIRRNERDWKKISPWDPKLSGSMSVSQKKIISNTYTSVFFKLFFSHDPLKKWAVHHKLCIHTHAHTPIHKHLPLPSMMHSNTFCLIFQKCWLWPTGHNFKNTALNFGKYWLCFISLTLSTILTLFSYPITVQHTQSTLLKYSFSAFLSH